MTIKKFIEKIILYGLEFFGIYYSKYESIVVNIDDPEQLGRIKVKNIGLFGKDVSAWAFPSGMFAGKDKCLFSLPSVGDIVYISFKMGNIQYPTWEYGLWAKGQLPSEATKDYGNIDVWKTKSGLILEFDNSNETIKITHPKGLEIELSGDKVKLGNSDHVAVLGDILKPELERLKANQDLIVDAITNSPVAPNDGGATFKTGMISILAAKQPVDLSNINSETVTLK